MNCGRKLPSVAVFCPKCGTKVEAPTCPACGTEVEADADFCLLCGTRLNEPARPDPAPASAPAQPAPAPTPRSAPASGLESAFETVLQSGPAFQEKPRKKWPTYVAIALTLCAILAAFLYSMEEKAKAARALEKSLTATWNAYYVKETEVDGGAMSSQALSDGELRLALRGNHTFLISTRLPGSGTTSLSGTWSCPDGETLALDYGDGQVVKMSVEVGGGLLYTQGTDGVIEAHVKWSKK